MSGMLPRRFFLLYNIKYKIKGTRNPFISSTSGGNIGYVYLLMGREYTGSDSLNRKSLILANIGN